MAALYSEDGYYLSAHILAHGREAIEAYWRRGILAGGHVDFISTSSGFIPLVEAGQLRLLAVYSSKRASKFPDVPTTKELGYGVVQEAPIAVFGPKGMPADVVKSLHDAFRKAMDDPAFVRAMDSFQMPILYMSTAELTKYWAQAYVDAGDQVKKYIQGK